jgi:hypothetical protein
LSQFGQNPIRLPLKVQRKARYARDTHKPPTRQLDARELMPLRSHSSLLPNVDISGDAACNAAAAVTFIDSLESLH